MNVEPRRHILPLDGLRGLALLLVFLLHTVLLPPGDFPRFTKVLSFGHWGVDLFFCLSGFLITGILYAAKGDDYYFRNFYARRSVRIFPLYYLFLVLYYVLVVRWHVVNFGAQKALEAAQDLHWLWFYGTNVRIALERHYITASINHFWTLAVEEHFYLVWPFLVLRLSRRGLLRAIAGIALAALVLRIWLEHDGVTSYVITSFTLCRVDSFAIGGAMSLLLQMPAGREGLRRFGYKLILPILAVAIACHSAGRRWELTLGFSSVAVFFSLLIAFATAEEGRLQQVLSAKPLRFLGKYSYALYVFHWPIQIAVARRLPIAVLLGHLHSLFLAILVNVAVVGGLSCVCALLTWNLVEKRCLALKRFFPESRVPSDESKSTPVELIPERLSQRAG